MNETLSEAATTGSVGDSRASSELPQSLIDPAVVKVKFEREVSNYRSLENEYLRRGWILLRAEFPEVVVLFAASHIKPAPLLFGAKLDFTNYDFWPPSLTFVNPFTLVPLLENEMPTQFPKRYPRETPPGLLLPLGV